MKGSGAFGNSCRAAARSPPCRSGTRDLASHDEPMSIAVTLVALLIEATFGYPERVLRAIGHPVTWIGWLIARLDRNLNRDHLNGASRRLSGAVALILIIVAPVLVAVVLERGLAHVPFGFIVAGLLASTLLAQRSLHAHVARVADALETSLDEGRKAVSHI